MVNIFEAANKDGAIWPQSRDNQYSFQTLFTILIPAHQRQQLQHYMLQVAWRDASSQHKVAPGRNWESMCEVPAERGGTEYVCRLVDLANVRKERMARNFSLAEVFPQNKPSWKVAPSIRVKQSRLKVKIASHSFPHPTPLYFISSSVVVLMNTARSSWSLLVPHSNHSMYFQTLESDYLTICCYFFPWAHGLMWLSVWSAAWLALRRSSNSWTRTLQPKSIEIWDFQGEMFGSLEGWII